MTGSSGMFARLPPKDVEGFREFISTTRGSGITVGYRVQREGGGRGLSRGMNVAASYSRTISVSSYEYGCVCLCKRMCAYS